MQVDHIEQTTRNGQAILSARIHTSNGSDEVYFGVPKTYASFAAHDATPFVPLLTVIAMKQGEDLMVDGPVSEELMESLPHIMQTLAGWQIGYQMVNVIPSSVMVQSRKISEATGSFFSGGLDSFYTLLKHLKHSGSEHPITHAIFVRGYDMDYKDDKMFYMVRGHLEAATAEEGIELIPVETNIRDFADRYIDWHAAVSLGLISVGYFLRNGFRRLYIAASDTMDHALPSPSHPELDPLWSTNDLAIMHDGVEVDRIQKIRNLVGNSPIAMTHLRVCYKNGGGSYNCGRCSKCLSTMIELRSVEMLDRVKTLPHEISPSAVRKMIFRSHCAYLHLRTSLEELKKANIDPPLQTAIADVLASDWPHSLSRRIRDTVRRIDGSYNRNRLYKFLSRRGMIT